MTARRTIIWREQRFEIEDACLEPRWWRWSRMCACGWLPLPDVRVVTLGYHWIEEAGAMWLLWATENGQLHYGSPLSLFPILDDAAATDGAADFLAAVINRYAVQGALL